MAGSSVNGSVAESDLGFELVHEQVWPGHRESSRARRNFAPAVANSSGGRGPGRLDQALDVFAERAVAVDRTDDHGQPVQ
jgi:hypothetical protein